MALLHLAAEVRRDLIVIHLNHQARGPESDADAALVVATAARLGLRCVASRLDEVTAERASGSKSAFYRRARLTLFGHVCQQFGCQGVLVAHHAADQAETVLLRILRGAGPAGPLGMAARAKVAAVKMYRPLLGVEPADLRDFLTVRGIVWREDASNARPVTARNRWRPWLAANPEVARALIGLGEASAAYRAAVEKAAPTLAESFACGALADLARPVAEFAAKAWLVGQGVNSPVAPDAVGRLVLMARDAASARQVVFAGGVVVRRQRGFISRAG